MEMLVWNMVLTGIVAVLGFVVKEKFAELQRLGILLNKTREEVARDHVTRAEVRADAQVLLPIGEPQCQASRVNNIV
jgi:hypothetical protein